MATVKFNCSNERSQSSSQIPLKCSQWNYIASKEWDVPEMALECVRHASVITRECAQHSSFQELHCRELHCSTCCYSSWQSGTGSTCMSPLWCRWTWESAIRFGVAIVVVRRAEHMYGLAPRILDYVMWIGNSRALLYCNPRCVCNRQNEPCPPPAVLHI